MAFTDADKAELADVQARRASGTPPLPGTAPDRARDAKRSVGPGSPNELAALGRIHEKVKAERAARQADEWHSGNDGSAFREATFSTGSVKAIPKGSGIGRVVPSISGIPGRN
jgi:hypothetical protein